MEGVAVVRGTVRVGVAGEAGRDCGSRQDGAAGLWHCSNQAHHHNTGQAEQDI